MAAGRSKWQRVKKYHVVQKGFKNLYLMCIIYFFNFQPFHQAHDITVSVDGKAVYVTDISSNKIWKFSLTRIDGKLYEVLVVCVCGIFFGPGVTNADVK